MIATAGSKPSGSGMRKVTDTMPHRANVAHFNDNKGKHLAWQSFAELAVHWQLQVCLAPAYHWQRSPS